MLTERLDPLPDNHCFGCGGANPRGPRLAFELDREARRVRARLKLDADFGGSGGIVHGGITALVFDEAMGKLCRLRNARAVTAELTVEYLRPLPCESEFTVEAWEVRHEGRNLWQEAEMRGADGEPLARARARFVVISLRQG